MIMINAETIMATIIAMLRRINMNLSLRSCCLSWLATC
jgi:hypothetical protein